MIAHKSVSVPLSFAVLCGLIAWMICCSRESSFSGGRTPTPSSAGVVSRSEPEVQPPPQIFFTDMDNGPNAGGESVSGFSGSYITIYGNFFGATQGTSTVTWNGLNCVRVVGPAGTYKGWGTPHFWYQKIIVQLGSSCTPGTGNFVVTVNGFASNGISFTVRSKGKVFFVSTTGKDSNNGSFSSPFATIRHCKNTMKAGDTCYIEDGVTATTLDNFNGALELEVGGTRGNSIAYVAYPGATATIGSPSLEYGMRVPQIDVAPNYTTVSGLNFNPSNIGLSLQTSSNWRVVGNTFQCPNANGQDGCFSSNQVTQVKFFGNEATNTGVPGANKQQHAVYFSTDTNHVEAAWNYIHDTRSCRAIQFHSSPVGGKSGQNQFDLSVHDNLIHDDPCDGINFATVDPSRGKVEAYNNVIYHVGNGPSPKDGDSGDYSCIYMAYITNTGPAGGGTVEIYNNTLYDCGSFAGGLLGRLLFFRRSSANGAFMIDGGETSLLVRIRNNIVYQIGSEPFGNGPGWSPTYVSGSQNILHNTGGASVPSFLTGTVNSDPLFVDLSLLNFHLQSTSPAKDAAATINSSNTYNRYAPWNGNPQDHDGVLRPHGSSFDIGAYEVFGGSEQRTNPRTDRSAVAH